MLDPTESVLVGRLRVIHEILLSMNVAIAVMATVFLYASRSITGYLEGIEFGIHHFLHMRQTDFVDGHIEFFLPATIIAIAVWCAMHLLSSPLLNKVLLYVGGIVALTMAPLWWLGLTYASDRRYGWSLLLAFQTYEIVASLIWMLLLVTSKWHPPDWITVTTLLLHNGFWIWQFGPYHFSVFLYNWQVAPFVGLCSSMTWILYLQRCSTVLVGEPTTSAGTLT